jgi:lysozyme
MHYGVDVSSNNPHPINWTALAAYLKQVGGEQPFAIVKITQGTGYVNPDAAVDVAAARAAGFAVAGYLMDQGNDAPSAEEQVFQANSMQLPQANDIELPEGLTVAQYIAHSQQLTALNSSALTYLNQSEVAEGFPTQNLWLAEYNGAPGTVSHACLVHQYTSSATVVGVTGQLDLNVWLGTEVQFSQYFAASEDPVSLYIVAPQTAGDPTFVIIDGLLVQLMDVPNTAEWEGAGAKVLPTDHNFVAELAAMHAVAMTKPSTAAPATAVSGKIALTGTLTP